MSDCMITFLLGCMVAGVVVFSSTNSYHHTKAAQTSCAQYNPVNGNFEWLEEVK